jgi:stage II sporulation protein E
MNILGEKGVMLVELLLDNLRNALLKGKPSKGKIAAVSDRKLIVQIAFIGGLSLLFGRVPLCCFSLSPCAVAWMTVLMGRGRIHVYALPFVLVGTATAFRAGAIYSAEMAALIGCTVFFLLPKARKMDLVFRALISGLILVSFKTAYFLWSGLFYLYDVLAVAMDLLLLYVLIYVLNSFVSFLYQSPDAKEKKACEVLAVLSIVTMLSVSGLGVSYIGPVSLLNLAALILTLLFGYSTGLLEGGLAGMVCGLFIMLATSGTPALAGILGCCGMLAGLFKGQGRILAGICFAGLALAFGLLKGYPGLYFSIYEPLLAVGIFLAVPGPVNEMIVRRLSEIRQDDRYYEMTGRKQVKEQLKNYQDIFYKLSLCCGAPHDSNPARIAVAEQFKGMARALETMGEEIAWKPIPFISRKPAVKLAVGVSGYAKEGGVSGDSYLCTYLREGEYLIVLSDGMGKGMRAAEESNLTVNTLYDLLKVGFNIESALRMINSILLLRSPDEVFSTVDMVSVNLYSGKARLYKIGAAASYIKRGNEVKSIKVSALPMGIIERIPVESISFTLRKGDQLIIVSDGITEADRSSEGSAWLETAIGEIRSKDPQTIADLIINRAVQNYGLKEKDDMTVIAAAVE